MYPMVNVFEEIRWMLRFLIVAAIALMSILYLATDPRETGIAENGSTGNLILHDSGAKTLTFELAQGFNANLHHVAASEAALADEGTRHAAADEIQADSEIYEPSHIPSSTSAEIATEETDTSISLLSPFALKSAIQTELTRLSCYHASVDGLWGPRSRAAVEAFNDRTDNDFEPWASNDLLVVLRQAPSRLCQASDDDIITSASGEPSSVTTSLGDVETGSENKAEEDVSGPSYLPPWMRGKKVASTDANADLHANKREPAARPEWVTRRVKRDVVRKRVRISRQRSRRSHSSWLPSGWPGSNR